jgi:hypothetical protein
MQAFSATGETSMSIALVVTISFWAGVVGGGATMWYWLRT